MEDGTEVTYTSEEPQESEQDKGMQYFFQMPQGTVTAAAVMEKILSDEVTVTGEGKHIDFVFDQEAYHPGDTVTAVLTPESAYDLDPDSITVTDQNAEEIGFQAGEADEVGAVTLTFQAAGTDMLVTAEAVAKPRYSVTVTTQSLEAEASVFSAALNSA